MGFDLDALRAAVAVHGRVARVVVAAVRGSSPREVGAAMLVWDGGQSGTIGGGALEFAAAARALVSEGLSRHALGPDLGQCCGGSVTLLSEVHDAARLAGIEGPVVARPVGAARDMPISVARILAQARATGRLPAAQLLDGWMIEPLAMPGRNLWLWGAGHVGRAMIDVLSPLPQMAIHWVDTAPERFPAQVPDRVRVVPAADPAALVRHTPVSAEHLILTYSHALDLELCHRLLGHGFAFAGLIGSASKWARFRGRLAALGHRPEQIAQITCPIGAPGLGKHPQAIAIGVAASLLAPRAAAERKERHG